MRYSSKVVAPTSADIPSAPSTAVPTVITWNACSDIGPTASRVFARTRPPVAITFMCASTAQSAAMVSELVTIVMFGLPLSARATSPVVTPPVSATACGPGGTKAAACWAIRRLIATIR